MARGEEQQRAVIPEDGSKELAPDTPKRRRRNTPGAPNTKGGKEMTRQNFSMHPDLLRAVVEATNQLASERTGAVLDDRAKRVTYSKIVAAFLWLLRTRYMTRDGKITDALCLLVAEYEASPFERPDDNFRADEIMEERRAYARSLRRTRLTAPLGENDLHGDDEQVWEFETPVG